MTNYSKYGRPPRGPRNLSGQPVKTLGSRPSNQWVRGSSVTKVTKVKKMNKLKTWLRNWIFDDNDKEDLAVYASNDANRDYEDDSSLRFNVTTARGGVILTVRNYDKRNDRHFYTAHVLHDDQNVAEGVAQIVSMELLRSGGT